jgi:hypothetical protein
LHFDFFLFSFFISAYRQFFDWKNFKNATLKRMFLALTNIGVSALEDKAKIKEVSEKIRKLLQVVPERLSY